MTGTGVLLLVALFVAHDLGDFTPLATARIRQAKAEGGPMGPIAVHAGVHALLVGLAIVAVARPSASILGVAVGAEFVTHFAIDATRARIGARIPALSNWHSNPFWWALGLDQLLHGLVLIGIAYLVLA